MTVQNLSAQPPFITKDGSTIRSILDRTNAPVENQSLAEARVPAGGRTERHFHKLAEELYFILEGAGEVELDSERRMVDPGDAIPIPPGAPHKPPWPAVVPSVRDEGGYAFSVAARRLMRTRIRISNNR